MLHVQRIIEISIKISPHSKLELFTKLDTEIIIPPISDKKIAAYGASATSTTLIYHYEMGDYLEYLVDDFEVKQGLYSPGYKIPCYHPDKIYEEMPDYIIVLAWRYHEKIISKHQKYLLLLCAA